MHAAVSGEPTVDLRHAFRPAASSVWVVTSAHDAVPVGFTAISVASVSLDPPLVSFNVARTSSSLQTLRRSGRWAAHLLTDAQHELARRFAGAREQRFADRSAWVWDDDGVPAVAGSLVRLSGRILSFTEAGDSLVALGCVSTSAVADGVPLVHRDRSFSGAPRPSDLAGAPR